MNDAWITGSVPVRNVDMSKLDGYRTSIECGRVQFALTYDDAPYPDDLLDDLIDAFGSPLDEVRGLYLFVEYRDIDEGCERYVLEIIDGRCFYRETELVEHSMGECAFRIG